MGRSETQRHWLEYLDGWRGLAVIFVIFSHFGGIFLINSGRLGVELFFVLSGRLMGEILFEKKQEFIPFIKRRIFRVWPALIVFLLVSTAVLWFFPEKSVTTPQVLGAITFTSNYVSIYFDRVRAWDHLWSLAIEEWTYLLLGAIAVFTSRIFTKAIPFLVVVMVGCMVNGAMQSYSGFDYYEVYWRTDVRMASILAGTIAYLTLSKLTVSPYVPLALGVAGVLLNFMVFPDPVKYSVGTLCLAGCIATLPRAPEWARSVLSWMPLRFVGFISFSLYLWQQLFYAFLGDVPRLVLVGAAFVVAAASYYWIEQPARRYLNTNWGKRTNSALAPIP
ncbi:acyltransferase family protein [Agrobacterium sp. CG674]